MNYRKNTTARALLYASIFALAGGCAPIQKNVARFIDFIEGEDRIELDNSTAEVSELVTKDEVIQLKSDPTTSALPPVTTEETVSALPTGDLATSVEKPSSAPKSKNSVAEEQKVSVIDNEGGESRDKESKPAKAVVTLPPKTAKTTPAQTLESTQSNTQNKKNQIASSAEQVAVARAALSGQVIVTDTGDASGSGVVLVRLVPLDGQQIISSLGQAKTHTIDMKNKTYLPGHLAVGKNDTIVFTNSDKIQHNVFSLSGKNAFDLGTYSAGKKRAVTLKDEGIVKVYCNIHPKMATFISVSDKGQAMQSEEDGTFRFDDIPLGEYQLEAWSIRGSVKQSVTLTGDQQVILNILASTTAPESHLNKFGKPYQKKPALFDDEFY